MAILIKVTVNECVGLWVATWVICLISTVQQANVNEYTTDNERQQHTAAKQNFAVIFND